MKITKIPAENVLTFENVELREPSTDDYIKAETIAGMTTGFKYTLALISITGTFDGNKYVMEDLQKLNGDDFLKLSGVVLGVNPPE
jgi:hypothetical protein